MFRKKFIFLSLAFLLWGTQSAHPDPSAEITLSPPLRAVQISVLEVKNLPELKKWFEKLKSEGINTIILRVFHNPGDRFHRLCAPSPQSGVYFDSQVAPVVCDLLAPVSKVAHHSGLKIYAWMTTRSADYGVKNREFYSWYYDFASQRYKYSDRLCIFHPRVRSYLQKLYQELARYPIDGILIQDDLMLKYNEDFHPLARSLYEQEEKARAHPFLFYQQEVKEGKAEFKGYRDEFWRWSQWKAEKLAQFVRELRDSVQKINPQIKLGMNLYYETALKPESGRAWFGQDLKILAGARLDFYCLMLYHRQIKSELNLNQNQLESALKLSANNFLKMIPSPSVSVIKLMSRDFNTGEIIPQIELLKIIQLVNCSKAGVIFFPASPFLNKNLTPLIQAWEENNAE